MKGKWRCSWCGTEAEVDTELPGSGALVRAGATLDGCESWVCTDRAACAASFWANHRGYQVEAQQCQW